MNMKMVPESHVDHVYPSYETGSVSLGSRSSLSLQQLSYTTEDKYRIYNIRVICTSFLLKHINILKYKVTYFEHLQNQYHFYAFEIYLLQHQFYVVKLVYY